MLAGTLPMSQTLSLYSFFVYSIHLFRGIYLLTGDSPIAIYKLKVENNVTSEILRPGFESCFLYILVPTFLYLKIYVLFYVHSLCA